MYDTAKILLYNLFFLISRKWICSFCPLKVYIYMISYNIKTIIAAVSNNLLIVWREHPTRSPYAKTIRIGFGADPGIYNTIIAVVSNNLMIVWQTTIRIFFRIDPDMYKTYSDIYLAKIVFWNTRRSFGSWISLPTVFSFEVS